MPYTLSTFIETSIKYGKSKLDYKLDNLIAFQLAIYISNPTLVDYLEKLRVYIFLYELRKVNPKRYTSFISKY